MLVNPILGHSLQSSFSWPSECDVGGGVGSCAVEPRAGPASFHSHNDGPTVQAGPAHTPQSRRWATVPARPAHTVSRWGTLLPELPTHTTPQTWTPSPASGTPATGECSTLTMCSFGEFEVRTDNLLSSLLRIGRLILVYELFLLGKGYIVKGTHPLF